MIAGTSVLSSRSFALDERRFGWISGSFEIGHYYKDDQFIKYIAYKLLVDWVAINLDLRFRFDSTPHQASATTRWGVGVGEVLVVEVGVASMHWNRP